jgi:hypothetical protein
LKSDVTFRFDLDVGESEVDWLRSPDFMRKVLLQLSFLGLFDAMGNILMSPDLT